MIRLLDNHELYAAEAYTCLKESIEPQELMERAGRKLAHIFVNKILPKAPQMPIVIACGKGNNGGDGLVLARLLAHKYNVTVLIPPKEIEFSPLMKLNLERLKPIPGKLRIHHIDKSFPSFHEQCWFIDAIFGIGLHSPPSGFWNDYILYVNQQSGLKVALDIPSGLYANQATSHKQGIIQAHFTLCIDRPYRAAFWPESAHYIGKWQQAEGLFHPDLQLNPPPNSNATNPIFYSNSQDKWNLLKPISRFAHKGTRGHACLVAGSKQMPGAATLALAASLKTGAGKTTLHAPKPVLKIASILSPEALLSGFEMHTIIENIPEYPEQFNALAMGPGCGTDKETANTLKNILNRFSGPLLLDADALNILAENPTWLHFLPSENTILTPHIKEFDRLTQKHKHSTERIQSLCLFAQKFKCYVLLKDAYTALATPKGTLVYNCTGNAGMATAGSGDVLSGMVLSLLAQGYSPYNAALLGMMLHGECGNKALKKNKGSGLIATDLIHEIHSVIGERI
jgi:hydroxyethylthiazole kinase-like uncharacterized protein yjeF